MEIISCLYTQLKQKVQIQILRGMIINEASATSWNQFGTYTAITLRRRELFTNRLLNIFESLAYISKIEAVVNHIVTDELAGNDGLLLVYNI